MVPILSQMAGGESLLTHGERRGRFIYFTHGERRSPLLASVLATSLDALRLGIHVIQVTIISAEVCDTDVFSRPSIAPAAFGRWH
jgi:hypothetical protein